VQMMVDPNSNLVRSLGYSMRRAQDDVILTAATADALEGSGATTAVAAGQIVGDYSTAISFDAITEIQEIFMSNDIDPGIPKVAIVGPTQVRKLIVTARISGRRVAAITAKVNGPALDDRLTCIPDTITIKIVPLVTA